MAQQVISVSQLNKYILDKLDKDPVLDQIAVRGEISNYKVYPSGHHYFTLKDESSCLKCVMFKGNTFRLRFRPANGMKVIAMGKVTVYPRDGAYQLYCTAMAMDGIGDLYAAFEQLKKMLEQRGLFDPAHKKPLPPYPKTVAIITSAAGAAVHDMLRILRSRYPLVKVRMLPVRVQGAEAPAEISAAIRYANHHHLADVLIVGRGGGSIEDLWAFNDEAVAQAIYESQIPVISAVGHEPDVTISDYVADVRAATPSNAAEIVVPDQNVLLQNLDHMQGSMAAALNRQIQNAQKQLNILSSSPTLSSCTGYLDQKEKTLAFLCGRMVSAQSAILSAANRRCIAAASKLDAMSPLKVLSRGYAAVYDENGNIVKSVSQVEPGQQIRVSVTDGSLSAVVREKEESHEFSE